MIPPDFDFEEDKSDFGPPNQHNFDDLGGDGT
jgi:hypothetical protein